VVAVTAKAAITAAQKLLDDDTVEKARREHTRATDRVAGLELQLVDAQQVTKPLYEDWQTKSKLLGRVQFVEKMAHDDAELLRCQHPEHDARVVFEKAQRTRYAAWELARNNHLQDNEQRWQETKARARAENRIVVPGFERTRNAQL
jgi:hypothetical protein